MITIFRLFYVQSSILLVALFTLGIAQTTQAALLYSASLENGDYGGGFIVDTFTYCSDPDGSSCGDGSLSEIGITDTANGVNYTNNNAVINYSLGGDGKGGYRQSNFRTTGTVSVSFKADLQSHVTGQPFTDNYGFNQFNSGQATFGVGMSHNIGADGTAGTSDDQVRISWNTWHSNVWYAHSPTGGVIASYDQWHDLGFAWDGAGLFEIWLDGALMSSHTLPGGVTPTWGGNFSLGSAYNFALGEIHQRMFGNSSTYGVMFADLEIWDEYRAFGATEAQSPPSVPEPATLALMGLGLAGLGFARKKKQA